MRLIAERREQKCQREEEEEEARWDELAHSKEIRAEDIMKGVCCSPGWHFQLECVLHKHTRTHGNGWQTYKLEQGEYTAIKGWGKKVTSLLSHIKLVSFSTFYRFFVFSPSGVHTSLPESTLYVSDSLLIGETEKKTTLENNRSVCTYGSKWMWSRWNVPAYTKSDSRSQCVHKKNHKVRFRQWEKLYRDRRGWIQHFSTFATNTWKISVFISHSQYYTVIKVLWDIQLWTNCLEKKCQDHHQLAGSSFTLVSWKHIKYWCAEKNISSCGFRWCRLTKAPSALAEGGGAAGSALSSGHRLPPTHSSENLNQTSH